MQLEDDKPPLITIFEVID